MLTRTQRKVLSRTIAVASYKGGVGKTSTTANLAALFAEEGHRVLVLDLDDQADMRTMFGINGSDIDDDGADMLAAFTEGRPFQPQPSGVINTP